MYNTQKRRDFTVTTTVYDIDGRQVSSDTRWSANLVLSDGKKYVAYVDDCEFEKIADLTNSVLVLAGNGVLIAQWKKWWYTSRDPKTLPPTDINGQNVISLLIIDKLKDEIIFDAGNKKAMFCYETERVISVFSGSGDIHAASCWDLNRCAKKAIETASNADIYTSNIVRFVDFNSGETNLEHTEFNYQCIVDAIMERGFVVNISTSPAANEVGVPLSQDKVSKEIKEMLASGKAVASAPVPGIGKFQWNQEQKDKLAKAIERVNELESM